MRSRAWFDIVLAGELLCLLLAAPFLYFPNWFPQWCPLFACTFLAAGVLWRRWRLGIWLVHTPADWAILILFLVMLPVAVWAAPVSLREQYSLPRAYILLWNLCLFWTVVTHSSRSRGLATAMGGLFIACGAVIALLAPLGIRWVDKVPGLGKLLLLVPSPLMGVFRGAEDGFSPNQVAGALLYVLPLALVWVVTGFGEPQQRRWWLLTVLAGLIMLLVLLMTQSRAGLLGLGVGMTAIFLLTQRWGRWILVVGSGVALLTMPLWLGALLEAVNGVPSGDAIAVNTFVSRQEIWSRAIYGIYDFPITGVGLGTFRAVIWLLYPLFLTVPGTDIAHAHNFFLQTTLDFGIPGLIALAAIYLCVVVQIWLLWRLPHEAQEWPTWNAWGIGFAASLLAQTIYSQLDAVAFGAKPGFLLWYLLALALGLANLAVKTDSHGCIAGDSGTGLQHKLTADQ